MTAPAAPAPAPDLGAIRARADRPWSDYPLDTVAHDPNGSYWTRVPEGWRANGGDVFPTPAASALSVTLPVATTPAPIHRPMAGPALVAVVGRLREIADAVDADPSYTLHWSDPDDLRAAAEAVEFLTAQGGRLFDGMLDALTERDRLRSHVATLERAALAAAGRMEALEDALRTAHAALRVEVPHSEEGYSGRRRAEARAAIEATGVYGAVATPAPGGVVFRRDARVDGAA